MESNNSIPNVSSAETSSTTKKEVMLASENPKKRAGRRKFKETRHPVYRGVRSRNSGKWVCEVRHPVTQSRVWLGTHPTAEMAARAHDVAVLAMRGRSACLNFADSVWRLPVPETNEVRDIQRAAAEAAESFRQSEIVLSEIDETQEIVGYVDEEELFGMPGFLDNMAQALMVPPPKNVGYGHVSENADSCADICLWSI